MSEIVVCDYCNASVNKYSLKRHKNTSKKCLKVQGKIKCELCSKVFTTNGSLTVHYGTHKNLVKILEELKITKDKLERAERTILRLRGFPRKKKLREETEVKTIETTRKELDVSDEKKNFIAQIVGDKYTDAYLGVGICAKRIADFVQEHIVQIIDYKYTGVGTEFIYINNNGDETDDPNAGRLLRTVCKNIYLKIFDLLLNSTRSDLLLETISDEIMTILDNPDPFIRHLIEIND